MPLPRSAAVYLSTATLASASALSWTQAGEVPFSLVTTAVAEWDGALIVPGSESQPGVRSPLVVFVVARLDGGFGELVAVARADDKLRLVQWSGDYTTPALWVILLGCLFSQLVPYVSDQSTIQRYMTTTDVPAAGRAIWANAWLAIVNTIVFLAVGTAIYVYYRNRPAGLEELPRPDAILPFFIARELPPGVAGLVVAGIFAAAQSAISTSLSSTSTVIVTDFLQRFGRHRSDARLLTLAKVITAALGVVAVGLAALLASSGLQSAFDASQKMLGLFGSGLAGLFLLGMFTKRVHATGALAGAFGSAALIYFVQGHTPMHGYLYAAVGILSCVIIGYIVSLVTPPPLRRLALLSPQPANPVSES
jgi:Na+/proline symporter